jgi:branched-chain amino acid transport system substrate-binding protein
MFGKYIAATIGVLALFFVGTAQAADPVKIGYSISKTGLFSKAAPSQITAYELWRDQVNAAGGLDVAGKKRPVKLIWYDDESNPTKAAQIYEKLITDDKVDLLLAPWGTPHHLNVAGVVEKYKFPMVGNTAASVAIRKISPGYIWFPTSAIPDRIGKELAALAKANGVKSAAVISNVLPFSQENRQFLLPALKQAGIQVKVNEQYPPDVKDMTTMLTSIKKSGVDAVFALSYPADSFLYMGQAKELGIKAPLQFLLVGPTIEAFGKAFGNFANGIVTIGHWSPHQKAWGKAKPFFEAYKAKFNGATPDYLDTALAYMSAEILQQAVAKAGLDKAKLRDVIAKGTFETINGPVRFDGVQNAVTPTAFLQMQKGEMHLIWPKSIATSAFKAR